MTQNGLPIARPTPNTSQLSCESSCRWTVSDTVLGWGSRPLVFFARYLAGRLERPAVLPCVAQTGVVSPVGGDQAPGITRGVSFRVRGQSSPHRATQRLSAGRARDHPVMEIVPNKALSLSLSVWFLLTTRARRWAPPRAAVTRWWPSTDPASSPSLQGATTARYPPGVRPEGRGRRE